MFDKVSSVSRNWQESLCYWSRRINHLPNAVYIRQLRLVDIQISFQWRLHLDIVLLRFIFCWPLNKDFAFFMKEFSRALRTTTVIPNKHSLSSIESYCFENDPGLLQSSREVEVKRGQFKDKLVILAMAVKCCRKVGVGCCFFNITPIREIVRDKGQRSLQEALWTDPTWVVE